MGTGIYAIRGFHIGELDYWYYILDFIYRLTVNKIEYIVLIHNWMHSLKIRLLVCGS
jgi:hypothetical protein